MADRRWAGTPEGADTPGGAGARRPEGEGTGLAELKGMTRLRQLRLDRTGVQDVTLAHLKNLLRLEWVSLERTGVTDAGLDHLAAVKTLRWIRLKDTNVTEAGVTKFKAALPACEISR